MQRSFFYILLVLLLGTGSVSSVHADEGAFLGTSLGAVFGGLFGSQFGRGAGKSVTTGTGILVGGLIGNDMGRSIDAENSEPTITGRGYIAYNDPGTTPISFAAYAPNYVAPPALPPTYIDPGAGTYCRPYSQQIIIAGRREESYGTACLQPDGTWRVVP